MKDLMNKVGKAIEDTLSYKGAMIEVDNKLIHLDDENVEVLVKGEDFDRIMATYEIAKMLEEGKIQFVGDCETDIKYLKKLVGEK